MTLQPHPWLDSGPAGNADRFALRDTVQPAPRDSWTDAAVEGGDGFDDLLCMAAQLLDSPIALIAVADGAHFRIAAERGFGGAMVACEHAIWRALGPDMPLLVLPDAAADPRFRDDPAVACPDGIRGYLGIALFGANGLLLGMLGLADRRPRAAVSEATLAVLARVARLASRLIERQRAERGNRIAEQISHADFSAVVVLDAANTVTFANAAAQTLFGAAAASGRPAQNLFPAELQSDPDAVARWLQPDADDANDTSPATCELHVRRGDGSSGLRLLEAVRCAWRAGEQSEMALILRDVTDARRLQLRRRRADQEDPLTGLPSRAALLATLDTLRAQATPVGVALLGLDNFRSVNHTLGHAVGDTVLQVVACRLLAGLPAGAHLARFSGDEFALVFPASAADEIEAQLRTMLHELARPCEVDSHRVHLEAGIGLALDDAGNAAAVAASAADDSKRIDSGELIARAGLAMQHAKRAAGQRLRRFEPAMRTDAIECRKLDLELHRACRDGEFELHYQPQIDLASALPTGAEALLRWRHPERGLLLPGAFIDALARSPVAPTVGRWIMQQACRDAATWSDVDGRRLTVGVNLFPVQYDDKRFLDEVERALALSGLAPARLELELTESIALHDDGAAEHALAQLRARGIRVAYDDFGTGYASLSMLHRLQVDRVKIDRSFVSNLVENRGSEAIVRSIALIARNFDLQVIAEGVETPFQAAFLREIGCDEVQGFLYSKALAPVEFDRWLSSQINQPSTSVTAHG